MGTAGAGRTSHSVQFIRPDAANLGLAHLARKAVTGIEMPVALLTTSPLTWRFLAAIRGLR